MECQPNLFVRVLRFSVLCQRKMQNLRFPPNLNCCFFKFAPVQTTHSRCSYSFVVLLWCNIDEFADGCSNSIGNQFAMAWMELALTLWACSAWKYSLCSLCCSLQQIWLGVDCKLLRLQPALQRTLQLTNGGHIWKRSQEAKAINTWRAWERSQVWSYRRYDFDNKDTNEVAQQYKMQYKN